MLTPFTWLAYVYVRNQRIHLEVEDMNIIDELTWRGAINQQTDAEGLKELTENKSISL